MKLQNYKVAVLTVLLVTSTLYFYHWLYKQEPLPNVNSQQANTQQQRILGVWGGGDLPRTEPPRVPLVGRRLLEQRARAVQQVCRLYNVQQAPAGSKGPLADYASGKYVEYVSTRQIRVLHSANTLACVLNKVASTTLVVSFLKAGGHPLRLGAPHTTAKAFLKPETKEEFDFARQHYFKFLVVRHPFQRLLSAYRDKVEIAHHLVLKTLRKDIFKSLAAANLTEERPKDPSQNAGEDIPIFRDFLEYILLINKTGDWLRDHWAPYWQMCSPCALQYDAVAKLETVNTDLKYIWQKIGFYEETVPRLNWTPQATNGSVLNPYYHGLSIELIVRVYHHFFLDFELFQYSILDVVREGGHCQKQDCSDMISNFS